MEKKEQQVQQAPTRKPFRTPHLRVYGHISAITQAMHVPGGNPDGGSSGGLMRTAA